MLPGLSCLSTTESGKWSRKAESLKRALSWEFLSWDFEIRSEFFCLSHKGLQTSQPIGKLQANCSMEIQLQVHGVYYGRISVKAGQEWQKLVKLSCKALRPYFNVVFRAGDKSDNPNKKYWFCLCFKLSHGFWLCQFTRQYCVCVMSFCCLKTRNDDYNFLFQTTPVQFLFNPVPFLSCAWKQENPRLSVVPFFFLARAFTLSGAPSSLDFSYIFKLLTRENAAVGAYV